MFIFRLISAVLLFCAIAGSAAAQNGTRTKFTLVHAYVPVPAFLAYASSLPLYLGYWREEGLDVEIVRAEPPAALQALAGAQADVAIMGLASVMLGVQRGIDVRGYYASVRGDTFGIALPADSGLRSLTQLRGKTLGVAGYNSAGALYARALMRSLGMEPGRDYAIADTGLGATAAAAFNARQVQAFAFDDIEHVRLAQQGVALGAVVNDPRADTHASGVLVVRSTDIAGRRAQLIGFARGMARAQAFQAANPEAAVQIHWRMFPQLAPAPNVLKAGLANELRVLAVREGRITRDAARTGRWGDLARDGVARYQNYLIEAGAVTQMIDPERYFSRDLIEEINRFDDASLARYARAYRLP